MKKMPIISRDMGYTLAEITIDHFKALILWKKRMLKLKEYPKISTTKDIQTLTRSIRILEKEYPRNP